MPSTVKQSRASSRSDDKKRKRTDLERISPVNAEADGEPESRLLAEELQLNMESEDDEPQEPQGELRDGESSGESETFPELDTGSSDEEDEEVVEDEVDSEDGFSDLGNNEEKGGTQNEALPGVYPGPRSVISNITGYPKRVYPEIEPDYDSDSSTEDVCITKQSSKCFFDFLLF
jgi:ribosome biogenesis protein ERB1